MNRSVRYLFCFPLSLVVGESAMAAEQASASFDYYFSGVSRVRFEHLDGQFRSGRKGSDQLLAMRTLIQTGVRRGALGFNLEIEDSRTYLDDSGTPLSTSFVDAVEPLQVNIELNRNPFSNLLADSRLRLGRMDLDIGSRRFVERNGYRNTINTYTGFHWTGEFKNGLQLDTFYTEPVRKLPGDRNGLDNNDIEFDRNDHSRKFWALHLQNIRLSDTIRGELFVYGLNDDDRSDSATLDRDVYAPGFRVRQASATGKHDFELEAAFRYGNQSTSTSPTAEKVKVRAQMLHLEFGYTFESPWNHRVNFEYDFASGDDKGTGTYERYERFYGTRRGDLGNTSIMGPLTRSNISAAGIRYRFSNGTTDGRVVLKQALLDSASDSWIVAKLTDPTGQSGREIGQTFDFRVRHWLVEDRLQIELGGSVLWFGEFARNVPGGPDGSRTDYIYSQFTYNF